MSDLDATMTWINAHYRWLVNNHGSEWVAVNAESVVATADGLDHLLELLGEGHGTFIMKLPSREHLDRIVLAKQVRLN